MRSTLLLFAIAGATAAAACEGSDEGAPPPPSYENGISALLEARCLRCHANAAPSYVNAIGCGEDRLRNALARPDHAAYVTAEERARLEAWLDTGASAVTPAVHPAGFSNPRTPGNHAEFLRSRRYRPLSDPNDADRCDRCHAPSDGRTAAPGAPACTTCHTDGVQACGTCHGDGARAYPPRDPCLFPASKPDSAHATHVERGIGCPSCHAAGAHMDGKVDVACTGAACHAHGGAKPSPAWNNGPLGCNDCHSSPPPNHYAGACISCHRVDEKVHVNGRIDLGDGSGRCGACHGTGDDPRPSTGAHAKHPFACETCHEAPGAKHPVGGGARMKLGGLAARGGRRPTFDAGTCANTYCHEASGGTHTAPSWTDGPMSCTSCHGAPPPAPHAARSDCASCHPVGGTEHVDGVIELRQP